MMNKNKVNFAIFILFSGVVVCKGNNSTTNETFSPNTNLTSTPTNALTTSPNNALTANSTPSATTFSSTQTTTTTTTTNGSASQTIEISNTTIQNTAAPTNVSPNSSTTNNTSSISIETTSQTPIETTSSNINATTTSPTMSTTTSNNTTNASTTITETTATSTIASTTATSTTSTTIKSTTTDATSDTALIAVVVCLLIVLIAFGIALYFYCRGRQQICGSRSDVESIPLSPNNSNKPGSRRSVHGKNKFIIGEMNIAKDNFEKEYQKKSSDDNRLFRTEYLALPAKALENTESKKVENAVKNRYENILPFNSTRVVLQNSPESGKTDYINANYVSGFQRPKQWIASQGPKEETFDDFWQMIWEQNCTTIIMITNLIENGKLKCHKYWPGGSTSEGNLPETQDYGGYVVTLKKESLRNFYVVRVFDLTHNDEPSRTVKQFHYTAWPDFGVPGNASNLLHFRRRVMDATPETAGPIVIHCSAGVGRTGTFIAVDAAIRQIDKEGQADIFSYVSRIREERMKLIQTDLQYAFVHKAVVEYIKFGVTELSIDDFFLKVKELRKKFDDGEETVFETEFQKLVKLPLLKDAMKNGKGNLKKNRLLQIIPYDFNRVLLPRKPGQEKSDYINASFIDGFSEKGEFIVTQGPMKETLSDFWVMIWENSVETIVMLTKLEEKGLTTSARYWPDDPDDDVKFGDITIKLKLEESIDDFNYVLRNFSLSHAQIPNKTLHVTQYHYMGWPDVGQGEPNSSEEIFQIIKEISSIEKHPIVVHCSSGGGRSGVFCCLTILLHQIQDDGVVDVFQTVRQLREQRPHLIQSQDQYNFCYWSLLEHLNLEGNYKPETEVYSNGAAPSSDSIILEKESEEKEDQQNPRKDEKESKTDENKEETDSAED